MTKAFTYSGRDVLVTPQGLFIFEGSQGTYETASFAREAIDRLKAKEAKASKKKLSLQVIDDLGISHIITGVHVSHGKLLMTPAIGAFENPDFYASSPNVFARIERIKRLRSEVKALELSIENAELQWSSYSDGQHSEDPVALLEERYMAAKQAAESVKPL